MKHRLIRLSAIERALIERDWHAGAVTAQIQALIGDSAPHMVNAAGRVLYVVLGAVREDVAEQDHPDIEALARGGDAVFALVGAEAVDSVARTLIWSALQAAERLVPQLSRASLIRSACAMTLQLRAGRHIDTRAFEKVMGREINEAAPSGV